MSGLLKAAYGSPKATDIGGFKVQTSVYGAPIPIVYGVARVAGNLIHMPATPTLQQRSKQQSKGAAGGTQYIAPMVISLCEGPIDGIGGVWRDKDAAVSFSAIYVAQGWILELGTSAPTPWSGITSSGQQIGYQFTAYVANTGVPLPNNSMSSYSWEVYSSFQFDPLVILDSSPAAIIPDLLLSDQYGLGWPSAQIGTLTTFEDYCAAAGLFISPVIDAQRPARDHINEILEVANTGAVWSDGVIKFVPYGDLPLTGNGHTYTPNTTPLYDLTDDNFLPRGGDLDPVLVTRKDPATRANQVTVEYEDRAYDYNTQTISAVDQNAIELYGLIPMATLQLHGIKLSSVAQQVAQIRLQREQYIPNEYNFRLGWRFSLLEPMDLVTLTDTALGLTLTPVRITQVTELSDESGFEFIAEDWPFGAASATLYGTGPGTGQRPNANVDPGDTDTPVIVEAPSALASSALDLWIGASGGDDWGGCDVWMSLDNTTFRRVGQIIGRATHGTLTATLASGAAYPAPDNTSTLSVNVSASGGVLDTFSTTEWNNLVPLCYVEGATSASAEWLAYKTATLTSPGHYDLTALYRSLYGSTLNSHASGKVFLFINDAVAKIPYPEGMVGQTVYFKLPAFNIYGAALQDISTVSSFSYVIGYGPIGPARAPSQGTVDVDADGVSSWTSDFVSDAQSYRWSFSTSAYPADATVASSGTLVNLSGAHTSTQTNFTTLSFGQTVFITIVPFTSPSGNGTQLQPIHIRGAYLTYTASKTATYSPSFWADVSDISFRVVPPAHLGTGEFWVYPSGGNTQNFQFQPVIPDGVTITQFALDLGWTGANSGAVTSATIAAFRRTATISASTSLGSTTFTTGSQQTKTISVSESTTGRTYYLNVAINNYTISGGLPDMFLGNVAVTYSMPDPKKTV